MTGPQRPSRDLDREETADDSGTETPDRSRTYRLMAWLTDNLVTVAAGLVLGGFVVASFLGIEIPRNLRIIGLSGVASGLLVGRWTGQKATDLLWDPSYVWLVDLDARHRVAALYRMPSQRFREWSVEDGDLDWATPELAFGKNIDPEDRTVEGVWRGTLTDRELMIALENVKRCRETLEKRAQKGDVFEATGFVIIRNAVSRVVQHVVKTFEQGTLPDDGEALDREINDALEEFGVTRSLDNLVEDDADPTNDVAGLEVDLADFDLDPDAYEQEAPADD